MCLVAREQYAANSRLVYDGSDGQPKEYAKIYRQPAQSNLSRNTG